MRNRFIWSSALPSLATIALLAASGNGVAQEVKKTFDEIVEAAKNEPPVQWCTGVEDSESQPIVEAFVAMFPSVPEPNDFGCDGQDATERVISEWRAGAPQVDVVNIDNEIMGAIAEENLSYVPDWSVFDGSPLKIDKRYLYYANRYFSHGVALRVNWFNPSVLSREEAPKSLEECADPKYKGMIAVDVRPSFFEMMEETGGPWSNEKLRQWARDIAALDPLWVRGPAHGYQVIASGERGLICGHQFHGLFRGGRTDPNDPNAVVQYVIPKEVIARAYGTAAIAPRPLAPNGTVLFSAFLVSDAGHAATEKANPGYSSPYLEGSLSYRVIKEAGATVLQATKEEIGAVSDKMNEIILTEWGFPSPAR